MSAADDADLVGDVPIDFFLARIAPAYGEGSWWAAMAAMLADPDELELLCHLGSVLEGGGAFHESVVVCDGRVCNGMHRVVASILAGAATVPVTAEVLPRPGPWVEVTFTVTSRREDADLFDITAGALRSFPLGGAWVETDVLGGCAGVLTGVWECPAELTGALPTELVRRAAFRGLTLTIRSARTVGNFDELWEEDDDPAAR